MISAYTIRRSDVKTKLLFIVGLPLIVSSIASTIMSGVVDSIYTNFVIYNPTTWSVAPVEFHNTYDPVGNIIVFAFCLVVAFFFLWSPVIEDVV